MLGHLDPADHLQDLVADRLARHHRVLCSQPGTAAPARHRPMLNHTIRVSDHLPAPASMAGLAALLLT